MISSNLEKSSRALLIVFSIFFFGALIFVKVIDRGGTLPAIYFGLLVLAISFFWASRQKAVFAITSVIVVALCFPLLFLFEFALNLATKSPEQIKALAAEKARVAFDTRTPVEVLHDMRDQKQDAVLAIYPKIFLDSGAIEIESRGFRKYVIPIGGIANRKTILCNESGIYSIYDSDSLGFNNPASAVQEHIVDSLLVGDSFTHGACVSHGKDIGSLLRRHGISVYNLGQSGNGSLLNLAALREFGPKFKPKVVFWLYFSGNDLSDHRRERSNQILSRYVSDRSYTQNLIEHHDSIQKSLIEYHENNVSELAHGKPSNLNGLAIDTLTLKSIRSIFGLGTILWPVNDLNLILASANDAVTAWGGKLVFVYLPANPRGHMVGIDRLKAPVVEIATGLNIPVIDFEDALGKRLEEINTFPFGVSPHYSESVYELLADILYARFSQEERHFATLRSQH